MKKIILIILTGFVIVQNAYSQQEYVISETEQLMDIQRMREEIKNNLSTYKKVKEMKDSAGFYSYIFYKDKELKAKMISTFDPRDGLKKKVEWYFANGELIHTEQTWREQKSNTLIDNQKFYLGNNQLISWTKMDRPVDKNSKEFKENGKELVEYGKKLIISYNTQQER